MQGKKVLKYSPQKQTIITQVVCVGVICFYRLLVVLLCFFDVIVHAVHEGRVAAQGVRVVGTDFYGLQVELLRARNVATGVT